MEPESDLIEIEVFHGDRGGKDRKAYLDRQKLINCGRCPYHRKENRGARVPRDDRHKNPRRRLGRRVQ